MTLMGVNLLAVLVCGIVFMVTGMLWYSSTLFGKQWQKFVGIKQSDVKQSEMGPIYGMSFATSLVLAFILGYVLDAMNIVGIIPGFVTGLMLGFGFVATTQGINALYVKKPAQWYLIDAGFHIVYIAIMSSILATWK